MARRIDLAARIVFPIVFIGLLVWFLWGRL